MTSGVSVKSFLIADLLVNGEAECGATDTNKNTNKDSDEKRNDRNEDHVVSSSSSSSGASSPPGCPHRTGSATSSRESIASEDGKKWRNLETPHNKPGNALGSTGSLGVYQYPSFPMGYAIPEGNSRLGETDGGGRSYQTLFPVGYDYRHHHGVGYPRSQGSMGSMMVPLVGGMTQPGIDFQLHHMPMYGMPASTMPRYHDKGGIHGGRDSYGLFPLGRSYFGPSGKRKGGQIRFSNSQTAHLEKAFVHQKYLNANERKRLAHSLGLSDRQVKTWFQNRRAKLRKCKRSGYADEPEQMTDHPPQSTTVPS